MNKWRRRPPAMETHASNLEKCKQKWRTKGFSEPLQSALPGSSGSYRLQWVLVFPLLGLAGLTGGLALAPAIFCFEFLYKSLDGLAPWFYYPALGCSVAFCYLVYGLSILIIAPSINTLLMARLKPFRGSAVSFKCMSFRAENMPGNGVKKSWKNWVMSNPELQQTNTSVIVGRESFARFVPKDSLAEMS